MKAASIALFVLAMFQMSCTENESYKVIEPKPKPVDTMVQSFQDIIDEAALSGSILIYHPKKNHWYSNDFSWASIPRLPASTFKIPHSIIALETGVVKDAETMFAWDGKPRRLKTWEQDLSFQQAFHYSCVPCYQEVARKIGVDRMKDYIKKLDYGHMDVNEDNIDVFWLEGNSRISQKEQILFLERLYNNELPIAERTQKLMKEVMVIEKTPAYTISGKTGWTIRHGKDNAWFVGAIETSEDRYYFATNINPIAVFEMEHFMKIRKEVTIKALKAQGIIPNET